MNLTPGATSIVCMLSVVILSTVNCFTALAQEPAPKRVMVEIQKKDATTLKGKLLGIARDTVRFLDADNRERRIAMKDIRNIEYVDSLSVRSQWFDSPNTTRYLLTNSGVPLRKKDIVIQATYVVLASVQYGVSDRVSIGGGTELFTHSTYYLNTKVNLVNHAKYKFSAGASYYRLPKEFLTDVYNDDIRNLGMLTAASTWGGENHHLTLGAGYIVTEGTLTPPIVTLSGTTRIGRHIGLVTENWFLFVGEKQVELPVLLSLGLRYISKRSSLDFALFTDHKFNDLNMFPYVGYALRLRKSRQ